MGKIFFGKTDKKEGFNLWISPKNSKLNLLSYSRIISNNNTKTKKWEDKTKEMEHGLVCMKGTGNLYAQGKTFTISKYDGFYLPPQTSYEIKSETDLDVICFSSPGQKGLGEITHIPGKQALEDPKITRTVGDTSTCSQRKVCTLIGNNIKASRLVIGLTMGVPGNWTSWPPHEHSKSREEIYVYFDMPEPAFGIQLIYSDPEKITQYLVREGDAIVIEEGYHPNVGVPGFGINYVWAMSAIKPVVDRDGGLNVQPEFIK